MRIVDVQQVRSDQNASDHDKGYRAAIGDGVNRIGLMVQASQAEVVAAGIAARDWEVGSMTRCEKARARLLALQDARDALMRMLP